MLRKLLKYDFRECGRIIFPALLCVLIVSILGKILIVTDLFQSMPGAFKVLAIMAYVFLIFICCTGAPIFLLIQFYRHFYSNRAYLTHTLPVTTGQKLWSRIIASFVLEILTFIVCLGSILILVYDKDLFSDLLQLLPSAQTQFKAFTDMGLNGFLILNLVTVIISIFTKLLIFFASVSIGQFFQNHPILGSFGGYIMIQMAQQGFSFVLMMLMNINAMDNSSFPDKSFILAYYGLSIAFTIITAIACYIITHFCMEKRLNLN